MAKDAREITVQGFAFRLDGESRVVWSDGWEQIYRLSEEGFFRRDCAGGACFGHTDFYFTGKAE